VRETPEKVRDLQALIDRSHARTRPHMRGIIHPGKYSLTAGQVMKLLEGMRTIAVAAPAPNGAMTRYASVAYAKGSARASRTSKASAFS
jgi:hypothetical protein